MQNLQSTANKYVACVKISGERMAAIDKLQEGKSLRYGINEDALDFVAHDIADARRSQPNYRLLIGMGGGNFWRGRNSSSISPHIAHMAGRVSTALNAVFLGDALNRNGIPATLLLAPSMRIEDDLANPGFIPYSPAAIHQAHHDNHVVILAAGMGIPSDTSDAATLRAAASYREYCQSTPDVEPIDVDAIKLTKYDGLYTADPANSADNQAGKSLQRYQVIGAPEVLANHDVLNVVDRPSLELITEENINMLIAGSQWSLPEVLRHRPSEIVQKGIGTLVVPTYVEAVFHSSTGI